MLKLTNPKRYQLKNYVIFDILDNVIVDTWDSEAMTRQAIPEWNETGGIHEWTDVKDVAIVNHE